MAETVQYLVKGVAALTFSQSSEELTETATVVLIASSRKSQPCSDHPEYIYLEHEPDIPVAISDLSASIESFLKSYYSRLYVLRGQKLLLVDFKVKAISSLPAAYDKEELQLTFPNNVVNFYAEFL